MQWLFEWNLFYPHNGDFEKKNSENSSDRYVTLYLSKQITEKKDSRKKLQHNDRKFLKKAECFVKNVDTRKKEEQ